MMRFWLLGAIIFPALVPVSALAEGDKEKPIDHSSPESVAMEFVEAMGKRQWERAFRCNTLATQQDMALLTIFPAGAVAGKDEAKNTALYDLLKKYGVEDEKDIPKIKTMTDTKTLSGLFGDVMTWVSQNASDDPAKQKRILDRIAAGEHTDFQTEGDRATAKFHPKFRGKARTRHFLKVAGKWYIDVKKKVESEPIEKPIDHSSPESVAKEFVDAMGKRQWERAFRCMTLESQQKAASLTLLPAGVVVAKDKSKNDSLLQLLETHGLEKESAVEKIRKMNDTKKLSVVFGDVMTWVAKSGSDDPEEQRRVLDRIAAGEYISFKIEGDRATASFQPKFREQVLERHFLKVKGKWFVDVAETIRQSKIEAQP
jgi:uncharacterized protein YpuA (DUF1002 family)